MNVWRGVSLRAQGADRGQSERTKRQRSVGAAEAEGIGQGGANFHIARGIRNEIEVALGIAIEQIRRGRRDLIAHREHRKTASMPPAAPSRWPVMDLVDETASLAA